MQKTFNPTDYGFRFTADWYEFDAPAAEKAALKARNSEVKHLRAAGYEVRPFALGTQLITLGGIGTSHPQIEVCVKVYGLNARD